VPRLIGSPEAEAHQTTSRLTMADEQSKAARRSRGGASGPSRAAAQAAGDDLPEIVMEEAGLHLKDTVLWFDANRPCDLAFVSHATLPRAAAPQKILATDRTVRLVRSLRADVEALVCPYNSPFHLGMLTLELRPAGHILGSAQLVADYRDRRVVYTGEFNLHPGGTCEAGEIIPCDVLVIDATFGLPRYRFPPRLDALAEVARFVDDTLADGLTPVLLAHPLGQAQEVCRHLAARGLSLRVHNTIYDVNRVYGELGVDPGPVRRFRGTPAPGDVVVFPPHLRSSPAVARLTRRRVAALSPWSVDEGYRRSVRADAAFPLSNTADYRSLMQYVRGASPRRIYTVNGHAEEFARLLRDKGYDARALTVSRQLDLFS
jgi:putative mRNA 3-end processing factor